MGSVVACQCGWTLISPLGPDDVFEHLDRHVKVHHTGIKVSEAELREKIRTI
jgi:hypothetical protein